MLTVRNAYRRIRGKREPGKQYGPADWPTKVVRKKTRKGNRVPKVAQLHPTKGWRTVGDLDAVY